MVMVVVVIDTELDKELARKLYCFPQLTVTHYNLFSHPIEEGEADLKKRPSRKYYLV